MDGDLAKAGIVDSMHVMSNAANRLVVWAHLRIRRQRNSAIGREIQACIDALLSDFDRLRELLSSLPPGADGSGAPEPKSLPARSTAARYAEQEVVQRPINITFRGMSPSDPVEARIRKKAQWLEKFYDRLISCDVVVEAPHQHSRKGNLFAVTIEMRVPGGPPIVAGKLHHDEQSHEDVYVAIRDTFDVARRRLQEHARKLRGEVKEHEIPPHGHVSWLNMAQRYGFIDAEDGTEVYFHENALVDANFDEVQSGDEVRFAIHPGEGAKGPQASTVHRIGKHHVLDAPPRLGRGPSPAREPNRHT